MLPDGVKVSSVRQSTQFQQGGQLVKTSVYTYYVGQHGPFTLEYPLGTDTADKVAADIGAQVQKLKALGITITPQG